MTREELLKRKQYAEDEYAALIEDGELLRPGDRPANESQVVRAFDIHEEEYELAEAYAEIQVEIYPGQNRDDKERLQNALAGKLGELIFKRFCLAHNIEVFIDPRNIEGEDEGDIFDAADFTLDLDIKSVLHFHKNLLVKCAAPHYSIYVVVALALKKRRAKILGWYDRKSVERNAIVEGDIIPNTGGKRSRYVQYQHDLKQIFTSDEELLVLLGKIRSGKLRKEKDDGGQLG